jgi:hypothetical protein
LTWPAGYTPAAEIIDYAREDTFGGPPRTDANGQPAV